MVCNFCHKVHQDGVDEKMIEAGHPYYVNGLDNNNGAFVEVYKNYAGVVVPYYPNKKN